MSTESKERGSWEWETNPVPSEHSSIVWEFVLIPSSHRLPWISLQVDKSAVPIR